VLNREVPSTLVTPLPVAVLVVLVAAVLLSPLRINHDCAVYLQCGELLLDGKLPYVDFIDTNPPLIMYLNVLPAIVARGLHVNPVAVFSLLVVALVALSAAALFAQLRRATPTAAAAILAALWAGDSLRIWVLNDFGQREHLFMLLYVPFLAARWNRWMGVPPARVTAVALGIGAAVGVCLKPHFALIAGAAEVYFLVSRRQIRPLLQPEVFAAVGVGALYGAHFLLLPHAVFEAFFHRWLPFVAQHYAVYDNALRSLVHPVIVLAVGMALAGLLARGAWADPLAELSGVLGVTTGAAVVVYFLQHKGWSYHRLPVDSSLVLLVGAVDVAALAGRREAARMLSVAVVIGWLSLALCGAWVVPSVARQAAARQRSNPFVRAIEARTEPGDAVLFVSTSAPPAFPLLVQTGRRPGSRYLISFPIPMFYDGATPGAAGAPRYHRLADASPEERQFLRELAEDISTLRPVAILIDAQPGCQACPPQFSVLDYLEYSGALAGAMGDYREVAKLSTFVVYARRGQAR